MWVSDERFRVIRDEFSCSIAPEICVEILSPSNSLPEMMRKKDLYMEAGAKEYWLCSEEGRMQFFNNATAIEGSVLCSGFPKTIAEQK